MTASQRGPTTLNINEMTIEQKVGQMLVFGWAGADDGDATVVNSHAREIVEEFEVGGVVLLGRNVAEDLAVTAQTFNELQAMSREPLFIIGDQEGGMVARFVEGVTVFPSNMALGATGDPELAYEAASAVAAELAALGVNYNFAPTVDVNNNPDNPIIGTRSYGESAEQCARFAAKAVAGCQDNGVIATAKHFPGHGDTAVDSHLALPSVAYGRDRLDAVELRPFRAVIEVGIGSIMTTHIVFKAIDPDLPATLSHEFITSLLRGELGYDGVVVTDCMEMKAIASNYGTPEACVMCIQAGVDLVLVCHTRSTQRESREAVLEAVKDGRIPESRLDESLQRIDALKRRFRLDRRRTVDPAALGSVLRKPEHLALQREIAEKSVTLVRNEGNVVPVRLTPGQQMLVTGLHTTVTPLAVALRQHCENVEALQLSGDSADVVQRALDASANADVLVVPTCPVEPWRAPLDQELQARLVNSLSSLGKPLIVVAVREPYDLRRFPQVPAYVCTYGYRGGSIEAAAELICGRIDSQGRLPVTIPSDAHSAAKAGQNRPEGGIERYF